MEEIEAAPTTPTTKRKFEEDDSQNISKKIKVAEDKKKVFSSPNNVVDIKDINTSDNKKDIDNNLNTTQSQIQQNISQMTSTVSLTSSSANSTIPTPLPPPIKSSALELPKIDNTVNLEIENLFLEGIRNELPKLDISKEEDQFYRQLMEECIRTIKAYTYVSEKHLSNSTLKNAEREMNRAKKKYEKEKNRRIRLLEKAIKDKNKAQKEKERAIEKAEKEAKQQARLKAKAEKEKEKKDDKSTTTTTTTTVSTKEEKPKSNLPSITSFFTVKPSKQSSSSNNNKVTINNQNNKDKNNTKADIVLVNDVKDVDLAYQNTVKYLEICNKKTYDIDAEFKEFINTKKIQRKKKFIKKIKYHSKDNKLIQIIGTSRNGHRIPTMSYIEDKTSKVITGRHPLKCDPYVSYSFEDIDENSDDEEGDEDNVDDEEGEDLSQADSNEEEEEIELEEEAKEEGKNVNELDYHDGFLDSEENDQVMHLMNKINTGQRVAIIIQPYFGDMSNLPKELLALKIIKI